MAIDDPDLPAKINAGWWRMASEYGLLDDRREFLLSVLYDLSDQGDPGYAWVWVRLDAEWDFVNSHVPVLQSEFAGPFTDRFIPEFTTLSIDGQVLMNTTVWSNGTISTIAIRPDRLPANTAQRLHGNARREADEASGPAHSSAAHGALWASGTSSRCASCRSLGLNAGIGMAPWPHGAIGVA